MIIYKTAAADDRVMEQKQRDRERERKQSPKRHVMSPLPESQVVSFVVLLCSFHCDTSNIAFQFFCYAKALQNKEHAVS